MIIRRLSILLCALALGLSVVFLVPSKLQPMPAGISLTLPKEIGMWSSSREEPISQAELTGLAPDTGFVRRIYTDTFGNQVMVSIVLSGEDMANSIHRPERCLPAQGWTVMSSSKVNVPVHGGAAPLEVTRLYNVAERSLSDGKRVTVRNLSYYWFVGSRDVTASHLRRTFIDIQDRILHGENQRWAYITVGATITENLQKFGRNEQQTSQSIEELIGQIVPELQRPANAPTLASSQ